MTTPEHNSNPGLQVVRFKLYESKVLDTKLKGVDKWKTATQKDADDLGCSVDQVELARFHCFRSQVETLFMQLNMKTARGSFKCRVSRRVQGRNGRRDF